MRTIGIIACAIFAGATLWAQVPPMASVVPTQAPKLEADKNETKAPLVAMPAAQAVQDVDAAVATPQETEKEKALEAQLAQAQSDLKTKDALVGKLSDHLESALARLNKVQSPLSSVNSSVSALRTAKDKLEQQNIALKAKEEQLESRLAELSKQKQLFDLENRQLFEALNGRPYREDVALPAKNDKRKEKADGPLLGEM